MTVDRLGVYAVGKQVSELGMIFREQPTDDYGIDGQIETIENEYASGKLIAVQIKSGKSYFEESNGSSFVFRGEKKHYDYWTNHSLPVIIVLYNPSDDKCYWQVVNEETASLTEKRWKIEIPKKNVLSDKNPETKAELTKLSENQTEYERKFNSFLLAKPWMNKILEGNKIILCVEEWINKSSGRGNFKLKIVNDDGNESQIFNRSFLGFGTKPYVQVFQDLFPWADFFIDKDFYESYDEEAFVSNDFEAAEQTYYDSIGAEIDLNNWKRKLPTLYPSIEEWMESAKNIRPYRVGASEVAFYQLILQINEIGNSFLQFDGFINNSNFYTIKL